MAPLTVYQREIFFPILPGQFHIPNKRLYIYL